MPSTTDSARLKNALTGAAVGGAVGAGFAYWMFEGDVAATILGGGAGGIVGSVSAVSTMPDGKPKFKADVRREGYSD